MKRQATYAELRQSLDNMREAVLARLELKRPQFDKVEPWDGAASGPPATGESSLRKFLMGLWDRFFESHHG